MLGKPYWSDLKNLQSTWDWAHRAEIEDFQRSVRLSVGSRLISIGSGGSHSVAVFASYLHDLYTGQGAETATPLQALGIHGARDAAMFLFSAGGANPDVLGICQRFIDIEPRSLGVLCLRSKSPLGRLCRQYEFVGCTELDLPSGKDGFVATNSLLAFTVLLYRAYASCTSAYFKDKLSFDEFVAGPKTFGDWVDDLRRASASLWTRDHLGVLYGSRSAEAAARDMESKFTEAAIGPIQVVDFRNFAHGRHHWLDKKGPETAVLAFVTKDDEEIAARTLQLLPKKIPTAKVDIARPHGYGAISALVSSLFLSGFAAEARRIDPGRPHVKEFGRHIYHLNVWKQRRKDAARRIKEAAIERKVGMPLSSLEPKHLEFWKDAFRRFMTGLESSAFDALVLDYDGTICDEKFRFGTLPRNVCSALNRILRDGARLGIATGRGDSVRKTLRECLPRELWSQVVVAYHNGSYISNLQEETVGSPNGNLRIQELAAELERSYIMSSIATVKPRADQISVIAKNPGDASQLYSIVCDVVAQDFGRGFSCVRSSHSVDILGPGLGKTKIFGALATMGGLSQPSFLCIGDLGAWPGNDYQLLAIPYSLSVLEVSHNPTSCWKYHSPRGLEIVRPRDS